MNTHDVVKWSPTDLIEVKLKDEDSFLKIKETLERIGVASYKTKTLFQSCHIFHKRGNYYIVHFKELFLLDGRPASLTTEDISRRNGIIKLLIQWNLLTLADPNVDLTNSDFTRTKVIKYSEKDEWKLESKYQIGNI